MTTTETAGPPPEVVSEANDYSTWLFHQQDNEIYRATVSAAYHGKRERFYGIVERVFQAFSALTATAAFAAIAGEGRWGKWLALAAAISSILPLVFGFAENARKHGILKANFKALLGSTFELGATLNDSQVAALKARVAELEAGEPAQLAALTIHCQNEIALRERKTVYPLEWWERLFMHVFDFNAVTIIERKTKRPRSNV